MKPDIRYKKTERSIKTAFVSLLKEKKNIEKINVAELCRLAEINRNTFYCHYDSVEQLLEKTEGEMLKIVVEALKNCDNVTDALVIICDMVRENEDFSVLMFRSEVDNRLLRNVIAVANESNLGKLDEENRKLDRDHKNMLSLFSIYGSMAILKYWVENGAEQSSRDIAEFIQQLCYYGSRNISH